MDPQKPKKEKPEGGSSKEPKSARKSEGKSKEEGISKKERKSKEEGKPKEEGKYKEEEEPKEEGISKDEGKSKKDGKSKEEWKPKEEGKSKGEGKPKAKGKPKESDEKHKPHTDKPQGYTSHSPPSHLPKSEPEHRKPHSSNVPSLPSKSKKISDTSDDIEMKTPCWKMCYDKETKQFCGRTGKSWLLIILYAIVYIIFLSTYTMVFLLISLTIIKHTGQYMELSDKDELYSYSGNGVGLSAVPSSQDIEPLIWYRSGEEKQYEKYINALDNLLEKDSSKKSRDKREVDSLGPCGVRPYGYGNEPCVIIKINKQIGWSSKPMQPESPSAATAPDEIRRLLKMKPQKLWLHCDGFYPWDREHLGTIKYYPDPPGFDASLYPLNMSSPSPLVGIQIKNFTLGISISIQCKLWYETGTSTLEFVLFVAHPRTF